MLGAKKKGKMNLVIVGTGEENNQEPNESQILNFPVWLIVGGGHVNSSGPIRCKGKSALVSENVFASDERYRQERRANLLPSPLELVRDAWGMAIIL